MGCSACCGLRSSPADPDTSRSYPCNAPREHGADATVLLAQDESFDDALRSGAPEGYDLVVDMTWGDVTPPVIEHANVAARVVQVGNGAGPTSPINAPAFRNKHVAIIGNSIFLAPSEIRREAYERMTRHALEGTLRLEVERTPLDSIEETWERLKRGSPRKLAVTR